MLSITCHYRFDTPNFEGAKLQNNVKRNLFIVICILLPAISFTAAKHPRDSYRIRTVVIDPGHGGHDSGCLGSSAKEKNIALEISLKLGRLIEQTYPDVKVIFTRKTDVFIPLHERALIANRNHADLFLCIHLNSGNKAAYGAETYVMGLHKTEDNLNVAKRENASILLEDDYKTQYDGFDPNSPEANIIFSLYQNQFMHQSLSFASKIQDQFEEYAGRNNRGVKQAGFLVLYKTAMPAVLVESGFLTHDMEEKYLDSDKGETTIATSIFRAFREYKIDMENSGDEKKESFKEENNNKSQQDAPTTAPAKKDKLEIKKDTVAAQDKTNTNPIAISHIDTTKQEEKPAVKKVVEAPIKEEKTNPKPIATKESKTSIEIKSDKVGSTAENSSLNENNSIYFTVQVGASTNPSKDDANFSKNKEIKGVKCSDGYTRYVIGSYASADAARKRQTQLKTTGYKDAFITAFNGNKRITVQEAEQMLKR